MSDGVMVLLMMMMMMHAMIMYAVICGGPILF